MFLNEDRQAELLAKLNEEDHQNSEQAPSVLEDEQNDVKDDMVDDNSTDDSKEEQSTSSDDDEDDGGHAIPYNRFKSVVDARNKFKDSNSALEKQIAELKAKLEDVSKPKNVEEPDADEDDWLNDVFGDEKDDNSDDARYASLESRIAQFEQERATQTLSAELQVALVQYPDVPESFLLNAVVNDPTVNILGVAEQYTTWMSSVQEGAVNKYLTSQKEASAPAAPHRPSAGGGGSTSVHAGRKPKTMAEARQFALAAWKNRDYS